MTTIAHCPKTNGSYIELVYTVFCKMCIFLKGCVGDPTLLANRCTKKFGGMVL